MYDTVKLRLVSDETERILGLLTDVETRVKPTGEYSQYGSLANMRVSVGNSSLTFQGSLSKYVNGNNLERFTRKQTQRAIEKMSDSLVLPIHQAKVWRIDLAENFILKRPVREYLSLLGDTRHFKRFPYDTEGLRYKNGVRQMVFYDKVKEYRDKKQSSQIPEVFQGRNVLRYELRFTSRLKQQFGSEIKALDLYNENFYIGIVNRWKNAYFAIRKRSRFKMDSIKIENVKGFFNQLALIGLETVGGEQAVIEMLENERENGTLDRFQFKRFKDKVTALTSNDKYIEPNDCILDLDQKVRQAAKYYR